MKGNLKRVFSILLVAVMLISLMPMPQSSALASGLTITGANANPVTAVPSSVSDGAIWTDKSVTYNNDGSFDVTLKAIGQDYKVETPKPRDCVDVVLVLDTSGSMKTGTKLSDMKQSATSAAAILLGATGNRVAVVTYSDMAHTKVGFTGSYSTINSTINSTSDATKLVADGGTNIQNALYTAQSLIKARTAAETNKPIIILMSDGRPTYYQSSLTSQSTANRVGEGYNSETTGTYVWNTVKQAMYAKSQISNLSIYTIGFGVGNDDYAIATLMPTDDNTDTYRDSVYSGNMRDQFSKYYDSYYHDYNFGSNTYGPWKHDNAPRTSSPGSEVKTYGSWTTFTGYATSPSDYWNDGVMTGSAIKLRTYNEDGDRWQEAWFEMNKTGVDYDNVVKTPIAFSHKYWENGSTIVSTNATAIYNAFVAIVNDLVNYKPMSFTTDAAGVKTYSNVSVTDVLGTGFEVYGALPAGVTQSGNTLTWTIPAANFTTMDAGSTTIDAAKMHSVTFTVKISDSAAEGTYYTNQSAAANFAVSDQNPAYSGTSVSQNLSNKGWLTLYAPPVNAQINITKTVTGPTTGDRTFQFGVYYDQNCTSAVVASPVTITVNGEGSQSASQSVTVPASCLTNGATTLYVKELSSTTDAYWTYDNTAAKAVEISRSNPIGDATFTNTYAPKGTLTVEKQWFGAAGTPEVTFDLQKETNTPGEWQTLSTGNTLNAGNKWKLPLGNLDLNTNYRVVETTIQDFNPSYDKAYVTFTASELEQTILIKNTYETPKGKITVNKTWNDDENKAGDRPETVVFNYTGPTSGTLTLTRTGNWTNFIETTAFGTYTITEVVPQDYHATATSQSISISQEPVGDRNNSVAFENTYVEPKGTLTIAKEWFNEGGDTSYRPAAVIVKLFHAITGTDGAASEEQVGNDIELKASNGWIATFNNLAFGNYRIQENAVDDYTNVSTSSALNISLSKSVDGDISSRIGGMTLSNSFNNPKGTIEVSKHWVETEIDEDAVRPEEITIDLKAGDNVVATTTLSAVNATTNDNEWSYIFTGLTLDGTKYTVSERASGDNSSKLGNYEQAIEYGGNGGSKDGIVLDKTHRSATASVTNTYAKGTITVHKNWVDGTNPTAELPKEAVVTLYMNKTEEITVTKASIETDEEGTTYAGIEYVTKSAVTTTIVDTKEIERTSGSAVGAVVFYDLEMGKDVTYTVSEDPIPYYTATIDYRNDYEDGKKAEFIALIGEVQNGSATVTNTYDEPTGSLTVSKDWKHGYNPSPATEATVELLKNGTVVDSKTFASSYTFKNLELGAAYTVREVDVPLHYTASVGAIDIADENGAYTPVKGEVKVAEAVVTITNSYIPEVGDLKIVKKWIGTTGGAIDIRVTRSSDKDFDDFSKTVTLNADNNWQATLTGLELYGPNGAYAYHATESGDLVLYSADNTDSPTLNATEVKTITIKNTYTPYKGKITITKEWRGENGEPISAPVDSIFVQFYVNGKTEGNTIELNKDNNWTVEKTDLDAGAGNTYAVKEVNTPEQFDASYSDAVTFSTSDLVRELVITNTKNSDRPEFTVSKTVERSTALLSDGKATFVYTVNIVNSGNRTLNDIYLLDEMTAIGDAAGAKMTYSPAPVDTVGGKAKFEVAASLAPEASMPFTYSVTVDKAGQYDNVATVYGTYGNTPVSKSDDESALVKDGLSIVKDVIGPTSISGTTGTFTYQLTIRNASDVSLYDVSVNDDMALVSGATAVYNYTEALAYNAQTHTFTIGNLDAGADDVIITYTVLLDKEGSYDNTATVTGYYDQETPQTEEQESVLQKIKITDSDDASVTITKPTITVDKKKNNNDTVTVTDEIIPESPTTGAVEVVTPEEIIIEDAAIPAAPLPKTGGIPALLLYGVGALLAGGGFAMRKKEKNK